MLNWIKGHKLATFLLVIVSLIGTLIASNSYIAIWGIKRFFEPHVSDIEIKDLTLSLWDSTLEIKGFSARLGADRKLEFSRIWIDWDTTPLWNNHIQVNQIEVEGFELNVESADFSPLWIGPLELAKFANTEEQTASEESAETSKPMSVEVGNIRFRDHQYCVKDKNKTYADLGLPIKQQESLLNICAGFEALVLKTQFTLTVEQLPQLIGDVVLNEFALATQNASDATSAQNLISIGTLQLGKVKVENSGQTFDRLKLENLHLLAGGRDDSFADIGLTLEKGELDKTEFLVASKSLTNQKLSLQGLQAFSRAADQKIHPAVGLNQLQMSNLGFIQGDISIESFSLSELQLLESLQEEGEFLASNQLIKVNSIQISPQQILVDTIDWQGFSSDLYADQNGVNVQNWFAQVNTKEDETESTKAPVQENTNQAESTDKEIDSSQNKSDAVAQVESPTVRVNHFKFSGGSSLNFTDASLTDPIEHKISEVQIDLKSFNLGAQDVSPATVDYKMIVADSGLISGKGNFTILSQGIDLNINGNVKAIDMTAFSQYAARFIGYRIDSGQLNIDYGVELKNNKIDANFKTLLEKFEVGDLQDHEQSELNEELGVPLPMALNLLRDSDDNIELEMPIDGDVNSPDVSIASVISTVSVKAIKNAVIYHYSPLGMLSLASGVLDLATALRFEPVKFGVSSVELGATGTEQLEKVVQLMTDKPKIKMVICGVAVQSDIPAEQPSDSSVQPQSEKPKISKQEAEAIIALAKQRQRNVIEYISEKGIDKSRLVGCNVKVDDDSQSQARVEISI